MTPKANSFVSATIVVDATRQLLANVVVKVGIYAPNGDVSRHTRSVITQRVARDTQRQQRRGRGLKTFPAVQRPQYFALNYAPARPDCLQLWQPKVSECMQSIMSKIDIDSVTHASVLIWRVTTALTTRSISSDSRFNAVLQYSVAGSRKEAASTTSTYWSPGASTFALFNVSAGSPASLSRRAGRGSYGQCHLLQHCTPGERMCQASCGDLC